MSLRLLLSCGEPSGDVYAGALVRALNALSPGADVFGLGGPAFAAAGGRLIEDFSRLTVTGLTEVLAKIPALHAAKRRLVEAARTERPDALVVIDFSGFNLRLASDIHALGIPVIYYISPQVWAWRSGRIKTIARTARRVLVIFPFERAIYEQAGVPVEFVGHPLIDLIPAVPPRADYLRAHGLDPARPVVALLPGSRTGEVHRILPVLAGAISLIRARVPDAQFLVAQAPGLADDLFAPVRGISGCTVVRGEADAVLASSDVVVTASGTATVQTALHGTPMVVVYKLAPLSYTMGRPLVKLETFAMVNLIAGSRIVPELIQDQCTPATVADEAVLLLTDAARRAAMMEGLARVRQQLGGPGASRRAAEAILNVVGE
ncbi:MAG: lipid-A-disaccharide synthase [Acidobacteriaceae bacterium]|nr:lipid-A-disaccharide synthase [Acidobacteriaceae bacterium]